MSGIVSPTDKNHLQLLRSNIEIFMERIGSTPSYVEGGGVLLDIAPQDHQGARPFFGADVRIETLDINPESGATYIADLCSCADMVGHDRFDFVVCTEVLEHTRQPFDAANSIYNMLKPEGLAFISTPFNFRIHGPLPDCWRFTEHGLRELFKKFNILELNPLETEDRFLMPIQYTMVAQKPSE